MVTVNQMREARTRLLVARDQEQAAMTDIRRLVRRGLDQGMTKTYIAQQLGISRQTLYNILNEK